MIPAYSWMEEMAAAWKRSSARNQSSGSSPAATSVEPLMSANRTVRTLRSCAGAERAEAAGAQDGAQLQAPAVRELPESMLKVGLRDSQPRRP